MVWRKCAFILILAVTVGLICSFNSHLIVIFQINPLAKIVAENQSTIVGYNRGINTFHAVRYTCNTLTENVAI